VERIGHRGAKREHPENTIAAFKTAFKRGADAIELDVHATKDGMVVVHHDPTLATSFGALAGATIAELDWRTVATASPSAATRIPPLSEVLGIVPAGGTVYVEIKGVGIESAVAATLAGTQVRCAVHSFDHGSIRRMRELAPTVPRGILFDEYPEDVARSMQEADARDVWPNWRLVDERLVTAVHTAGGRVLVWTVNDRPVAERMISLGVDGLCTDDVRLLDGL
jgi:glycerophosphoryl diester phosphodiesterase